MPRTSRSNQGSSSKSSLAVLIATWLALILSVTTLGLTLLGYGHDLAYLQRLGLRPEELQRTPLDFLLRSWQPVIYLLAKSEKFWTLEVQLTLWQKFWWDFCFLILSFPLLSALVAWGVTVKPWLWSRPIWMHPIHKLLKNGGAKLESHWTTNWRPVPTRRWAYIGWLIGPIFFIGLAVLLAGTWFIFSLSVLTVITIPFAGIASGEARAQQEVLNPIGCVGQIHKAGQDSKRQARCVRVLRDERELTSGYLIDYGAGRLYLYQPCVKKIVSISLERTVIEQVDKLDFLVSGSDCSASFDRYRNALKGK